MAHYEHQVEDVACLVIPEHIDCTDPEVLAELPQRLELQVLASIGAQYRNQGKVPPKVVVTDELRWLITNDPEDVEAFQPAHDCEECRKGNEATKEFLLANPGRWVAMSNMTYREIFPA